MQRSNIGWLLLLAVAGAYLAYTLFASPAVEPVALTSPTPTVKATATLAVEPASTAVSCEQVVPIAGGNLVEGLVGAPLFPNPLLADNNPIDREIVDLIFDGLVRFDGAGVAQPALAESWTIAEDGLSVSFRLRSDAQWHDGQPFSSRDVAFTYGLLQSAEISHPDSALWQTVQIATPDPQTVTFTLAEPLSPFLVAVTRGILPAHLFESVSYADLNNHPFNNRPIGTGPFIANNDWLSDGYLQLIPNRRYWRVESGISTLDIRFFASESERATAFANNQLKGLVNVSSNALPTLLALDGVRLFSSDQSRYTQLLFNLASSRTSPIKEKMVRESLALGINRDALLRQTVNSQAIPFSGPFVPSSYAANANFPVLTNDVVSATIKLDNSSWIVGENGLRIRSGGSVSETLTLDLLTTDSVESAAIAQTLTAQWQPLGVAVTWQALEQARYLEALVTSDFDIALVTIDPLDDPDLYDFWSQEAIISGQNFGAWNNRRASEALEQARQTWDVDERRALYAAFNRAFANDLPAVTLYQYVETYLLADDVLSAETNRPVTVPRIVHPRDRFATFPDWRVATQTVAVACE